MNLAAGNLGDDKVTGQNGKVKAITDNLDNARPLSVGNSPELHRNKN